MYFNINTQDLNAGISTVIKALSARTTMSILEGIYIEAADNSVLLKCNDLSLQIETILPAEVAKEGSIVLPGKLFSELVRKLPGAETTISATKSSAVVESGRSSTSIQGESAAEFLSMATVSREFSFKIKPAALKSMARQCIFAAAQDESRPILTGALLEIENGMLTLVALDGYRLALRREPIEGPPAEQKVVIPSKSLLEISRILPDGENSVDIVFSKTHVMIDLGHTRVTARLLDGEYIKYKQILPDTHNTRARVNREALMGGIERVALMARESKSNLIKFSFKPDMLRMSSNSELGNSEDELDINLIGADLDIAFNARYYLDVLKALDDNELYLDMNNNISPCVVRPINGDAFYYLILPVRLFSGM